jgi:hypothetical protein
MKFRNFHIPFILMAFIFLLSGVLYLVIFAAHYLTSGEEFYKVHFPNYGIYLYWIARNSFLLIGLLIIAVIVGITAAIFHFEPTHFKKNALLFWVSVFITFGAAEAILRIYRWKPGRVKPYAYFHEVDSLYELHGYICDSSGIMKVSPSAADRIRVRIAAKEVFSKEELRYFNGLEEVYVLAENYLNLPDNSYSRLINRIQSEGSQNELDSAILEYHRSPINEQGFRSIAFKPLQTGATKILLLGDSFTWGHSTANKTNSFADELLAKGYAVYNSGITATDPAQYLAVAKQFIPVLKPDVVIVNFYMGNDLLNFKRIPSSSMPLFTFTNAGAVMNCPMGVCFSDYKTAYGYAVSNLKIPSRNNGFNRWCSLTATGTLFWYVCKKWGLVDFRHPEWKEQYTKEDAIRLDNPYMGDITEIKRLCEENGSIFILSILPDIDTFGKWITPTDYPAVFCDFDYHMAHFSKSDYDLKSNHLNDRGNYRYSVFLDSLIQAKISR